MRCVLTILLIISAITVSPAGPRVIRVGAFNFYPGIFKDTDGTIKGFYVDSLNEISKEKDIRFEYIWGSWNDGLERIKSGEIDILTSVAYSPKRAEYLDYGKVPLLTVWGELYVLAKSEIDGITEIQDKRVALMKGDFNAISFIGLAKQFNIRFIPIEYNSFEEIFNAIKKGKADAGVVNCTFGTAKQHEYSMRSTGVVFNPFKIYFASAKGKNSDILKLLDHYLDKWKHDESSVFNHSRQRWSHGEIGMIKFTPVWLSYCFVFLGVISILFFIFTVLLKIKVKRATSDITKQKELLMENEKKLRRYIDSSPIGIFVVNENGKYIEVNPAASKITGYTIDELLSMSIIDLIPNPHTDNHPPFFQEVKKNGRAQKESEYRHKNGYTRRWSLEAIKLSEILFLGFARDTTESKLAEEKIQNLLKEKELLLKEVHHRIKNNMNTIKGLLTLQKHNMKDAALITPFTDAECRVQSMIVLYDKLYCSNNYREHSIREYFENLANEIIFNFPNRDIIKFETDIEDITLNVKILAPLGIIINELLTNIMKYAFDGYNSGIITLRASLQEKTATIEVNDNGTGIPEHIVPGKNSGFGLNLVMMLIEQIGGNFRIERENGTRFIIQFNIHD